MSAAQGIIKIIESATEAQKANADLKKQVMLHAIQQKMELKNKEAEFQQNIGHMPQIQKANEQLQNPMGELTNPGAASLGQNGIATNQTPGMAGQQPPLQGQPAPAASLLNPGNPVMAPASPMTPGQQAMGAQPPQAPAPVPTGVQIESPTGTALPPPKGAIQIGSDGNPVFKQLEPADKNYAGIYSKWRSGTPLSMGEKKFVQEYLGMKDMANDPFGTLGIDTVNNSPEQIGEQLKAKNPGYYAQLEAIKDGKYKITGRGSNEMNRIATQVQTIWPGTDLQALQARYDVRKDFTSGTGVAKNITSLNTLLSHLDKASRSAEALDNGWFRQGNKLNNILKTQTGDSRVRVLDTDINAITGEAASTFKGLATDSEIKNFKSSLENADSKQVVQDVLNEFIALVGGRTQPLLEKWQAAFGEDSSFPVVGKHGEAVLNRHGFQWDPKTGEISKVGQNQGAQGGMVTMTSPSGKIYQFSAEHAEEARKNGWK